MIKESLNYSNKYCSLSREELLAKVRAQMSQTRFEHVLRVEVAAVSLAERYTSSIEKASIAALVHDYAKERPDEEMIQLIKTESFDLDLLQYGNAIWHGILGALLVERELSIKDTDILAAVCLHTTGAAEMSKLSKIIYVADYIESGRSFPVVEEARKLAFIDLDQAVAFETRQTLLHLIERDVKIYPKTVETYNKWVAKN